MYVSKNIGHRTHKLFHNMYGMRAFMFGFILWLLVWLHLKPLWHIAGWGHRGLQRSYCCISSTVWAMSGWLRDVEMLNAFVYFRTIYGIGTTKPRCRAICGDGDDFLCSFDPILGCDFGVLFGIHGSSGTTMFICFAVIFILTFTVAIVHLETLWVSLGSIWAYRCLT